MKKRHTLTQVVSSLLVGAFCWLLPPVGTAEDGSLEEHLRDL